MRMRALTEDVEKAYEKELANWIKIENDQTSNTGFKCINTSDEFKAKDYSFILFL